ncbi:hypothetical protein AB7Z98_13760 [Providencia manganoxydans]|uniref:hypothetical protein n=1 Tax=Providencia manganoxydans TaxID=2923283 RepID=UPI0034E5B2DA
MMIDAFYQTRLPEVVAEFARCVDTYNVWHSQTLSVCERLGFVNFSGPDFYVPDYFFRSRYEHIQKVTGFKLVDDDSLLAEPEHIPYALRNDNPVGEAISRELMQLAESALSTLGVDIKLYGEPGAVGYQRAICMMLGIDYRVTAGAVVGFSQVWAISDEKGNFSLVCSVPVNTRDGTMTYELPNMPEGWVDITAQQVIHLFNYHNSIVNKE